MRVLVITKISDDLIICATEIDHLKFNFLMETPRVFYDNVWFDAIREKFVDENAREDYEIEVFDNGKFISRQTKASVTHLDFYRINMYEDF